MFIIGVIRTLYIMHICCLLSQMKERVNIYKNIISNHSKTAFPTYLLRTQLPDIVPVVVEEYMP